MTDLKSKLSDELKRYREQGKLISDINPISALADSILDRLYKAEIDTDDIESLLDILGADLWQQQVEGLAQKSGVRQDSALDKLDIERLDFSRPLYRAVFTAHPVFSLQTETAHALSRAAAGGADTYQPDAYAPRARISLQDEHAEAMDALVHARAAIRKLTQNLLAKAGRKDIVPRVLGVSTWVGYDMDGRADISWLDSFTLRLREKAMGLDIYIEQCKGIEALSAIQSRLQAEHEATLADVERFSTIQSNDDFITAANHLTERPDKLTALSPLVEELKQIAAGEQDEQAYRILALAGDMASHGLGMGEIHLRVNAVQLRNAMRAVDGRAVSVSGDHVPNRSLVDRLAHRIRTEAAWDINFHNLDEETATARRQFMLAAQTLKHVDSEQPIRFLIAECEQPITIMSALYLAHKFNISEHLDISPLFETAFGLERGAQMMAQLLAHETYRDYVRKRGRLAIQTGFSDAGRFIGQITANLAIERVQLKVAQLVAQYFSGDVDLLLFNTHGESMGRGHAYGDIQSRQNYIFTPFVRAQCQAMNVHVQHQSSFQGGDGYRYFSNQKIADATMLHLLLAETRAPDESEINDPFYQAQEFSLDMFLSLKSWHEQIFHDPHYIELLDMFGTNLLPVTGSRPSKRVVQAGMGRRDPSKIRAIPHNAILQQLGFCLHIISGIGRAAQIDGENFVNLYPVSPRLQQVLGMALRAKALGSLNTLSAYGRLLDKGFWIDRAYHDFQPTHLRAFRRLGTALGESRRAQSVKQMVATLRDDLIDLYRLANQLGEDTVRIEGDERLTLDMLHALRIALIMDTLIIIARTPRFTESQKHRNEDVLRHALLLDFEAALDIIREEFFLNRETSQTGGLSEAETYRSDNPSQYHLLENEIIAPVENHHKKIILITQMISAHYNAHG